MVMPTSHDLLNVDALRVCYGPVVAVDGVSLSVNEGEVVALIGANGAGKSSLLQAVVGLAQTSGGTVRFRGEDITGLPPEVVVKKGITLTPEGRRVFPRMSVGDNLKIGATVLASHDSIAERKEWVLQLFPVLRKRQRQAAGTLSGGEQQMLAIGRSLMSAPSLVMLDEPSLGLAPVIVDRIFELLGQLRDGGVTILLVEQNVHRSLEIADRAYVLDTGSLRSEGSSQDILAAGEIEGVYMGAM